MTNLRLKNYDGQLALNTTGQTQLLPSQLIEPVNTQIQHLLEQREIHIQITSITITLISKCLACHTNIHQQAGEKFIKCQNPSCGQKSLSTNIPKEMTTTIYASTDNVAQQKFTIYNQTMTAYLDSINHPELKCNTEALEDYLLINKNLVIQTSEEGIIVKSMREDTI